MQSARRMFRIESDQPLDAMAGVPYPLPTQEPPGYDKVLAEIGALKDLVRPAQSVVTNLAEAYRREIMDMIQLRQEFDAIQNAIVETKRNIASLHVTAPRTVGVQNVACELGAVVAEMETATNNILASAERTEMLAGVIQSETTPERANKHADEIAQLMMAIYESCNFQDLTGQRISRVVDALSFIETRVSKMVDIWGGLTAIRTVMEGELEALTAERDTEGSHALVNGPALVGEQDVVSQDEIDALFD